MLEMKKVLDIEEMAVIALVIMKAVMEMTQVVGKTIQEVEVYREGVSYSLWRREGGTDRGNEDDDEGISKERTEAMVKEVMEIELERRQRY